MRQFIIISGCVFIVALLKIARCLEREITISVDPRKEDCYYQKVKKGETIDIEYQVSNRYLVSLCTCTDYLL